MIFCLSSSLLHFMSTLIAALYVSRLSAFSLFEQRHSPLLMFCCTRHPQFLESCATPAASLLMLVGVQKRETLVFFFTIWDFSSTQSSSKLICLASILLPVSNKSWVLKWFNLVDELSLKLWVVKMHILIEYPVSNQGHKAISADCCECVCSFQTSSELWRVLERVVVFEPHEPEPIC